MGIREDIKCTGQGFGASMSKHHKSRSVQRTGASRYDCEQLAIGKDHPFYQYHAGKGLCVTVAACYDRQPIAAPGWAIYRDDDLWPVKATFESCSDKKRDL